MPVIKIWMAILTCFVLSAYTCTEPSPKSTKGQVVKSAKGTALPKPRDQPVFVAAPVAVPVQTVVYTAPAVYTQAPVYIPAPATPVVSVNLHVAPARAAVRPVYPVYRSYAVHSYPIMYSPRIVYTHYPAQACPPGKHKGKHKH